MPRAGTPPTPPDAGPGVLCAAPHNKYGGCRGAVAVGPGRARLVPDAEGLGIAGSGENCGAWGAPGMGLLERLGNLLSWFYWGGLGSPGVGLSGGFGVSCLTFVRGVLGFLSRIY